MWDDFKNLQEIMMYKESNMPNRRDLLAGAAAISVAATSSVSAEKKGKR